MSLNLMPQESAILVLEDGTFFKGYAIGVKGTVIGEIVFNTTMTGYQEVMTDPSYAQQIITFSYPHIGNVGVNLQDFESDKIWAAGMVLHDCCAQPSNWRATGNLPDFLIQQNVVGIAGVDTRQLVSLLRDNGVLKACISSETQDVKVALEKIKHSNSIVNADLTAIVSTNKKYSWQKNSKHCFSNHVVVYDFGVKRNILNLLLDQGCRVTVVPAQTSYAEVLVLQPDGIVLSNGPGDPAACSSIIVNIAKLLNYEIPIFGICLGHQLLALAAGAKTYKLKFGHNR